MSESQFFEVQLKALKDVYKKATEQGVIFILIAGDLFDSNYISSDIAMKVLDIFKLSSNIHTVLIPGGGSNYGNEVTGHDAYTADSIYKRPDIANYFDYPNITLLTPENPVKIIRDTAFYSAFFDMPMFELKNASRHIALVHGAFGKNNTEGELDIDRLESMPFDYIALGHYHGCKIFNKSAYPGAFLQFEFTRRKSLNSGFLKVNINGSRNIECVDIKNAPSFYRVEIFSEKDIQDLKHTLGKLDFVEISGYSKELSEQIKQLLKNPSIHLRENAVIYTRDLNYEIIKKALDNILNKGEFKDYEEELKEEAYNFILQHIMRKMSLNDTVNYLIKRFEI